MAEVPKERFGLGSQGWMRLDIASGALIAAVAMRDLLDKKGHKWSRMGVKKKTWDQIDVAVLGLAAMFAIRGVIDTMEEYNLVFSRDQVFPGKGLVATGITNVDNRFNVF